MQKQIPEAVSVWRKITYTSASSTSALRYLGTNAVVCYRAIPDVVIMQSPAIGCNTSSRQTLVV